jgi:hypothetical protein
MEDNIGMDFQEVGWGGVDWYRGKWQAIVNTVKIVWVPQIADNLLIG